MPRLEAFAEQHCVRVPRAISVGSSSLESHVSMFTGLYPPRHGAHKPVALDSEFQGYAHPLKAGVQTLAGHLRAAGRWTVGLSANSGPLAEEFGAGRGFDVYQALPEQLKLRSPWSRMLRGLPFAAALARHFPDSVFLHPMTLRQADTMTELAVAAMQSSRPHPVFLFVNYFDAHDRAGRPSRFHDVFPGRDPSLQGLILGIEEPARREVVSGGRALTPQETQHMNAEYDGQLAYLDSQLAPLLAELRQDPRWEQMLLIITADHGEALGEHRLIGHTYNLYDEFVRVPLFVKLPASRSAGPLEANRLWQSVDVFALVLEALGLPVPVGLDAIGLGAPRSVAYAWGFPPLDAALFPGRFDRNLYMVEAAGRKLIASSQGEIEAFDLRNDPGETINIMNNAPESVADLMELLSEMPKPADGGAPAALPAALFEHLKALGYVQ